MKWKNSIYDGFPMKHGRYLIRFPNKSLVIAKYDVISDSLTSVVCEDLYSGDRFDYIKIEDIQESDNKESNGREKNNTDAFFNKKD